MVDIFGTLGPSCSDINTLEAMFQNGMTGMRLNTSHAALTECAALLEMFHTAAARQNIAPKLLMDLQGPELRIGEMSETLFLKKDSIITFAPPNLNDAAAPQGQIPLSPEIISAMTSGQKILLDDGKILAVVTKADRESLIAEAKVLRGGILSGKKSIALKGSHLRPPTLTRSDLVNIENAVKFGVTGVMQPFVRDRQDIENVRYALKAAGGDNLKIYAKIENMDGVNSLKELIKEANEIVIARGDLGNAMPLWELPAVQKRIAKVCRKNNKPFMVVTQMLSSMQDALVPTRAEVSDIYNAVLDGAASVMVTGESAVGKYPAEVIRYLANTANEAKKNMGFL